MCRVLDFCSEGASSTCCFWLQSQGVESSEANQIFHTVKFPKQGWGHQSDISKPDCNAVMGLGRRGTQESFSWCVCADIKWSLRQNIKWIKQITNLKKKKEEESFLADIKSVTLEPDAGKTSASDSAHSDLGLLPIHMYGGAQTIWSWTRVNIWRSHKLVLQSLKTLVHKTNVFPEFGLHTTYISITMGAHLKCYFLVPPHTQRTRIRWHEAQEAEFNSLLQVVSRV